MKKLVFLTILLVLANYIAFAGDVIKWTDAVNHYGKYKTVEGKIVTTKCLPKVCFLNFDKNYKKSFTAVIFVSDIENFPPNPEKYYLNKIVQVSGVIKEYKGKPEMILSDTSQIEVTGNRLQ